MDLLKSIVQLKGASVVARDGEVGNIDDAFFDDMNWVVRYVVMTTGWWLKGKRVLLSPLSMVSIDWDNNSVFVDVIKRQVCNSPDVDKHQPVSRQHKVAFHKYYNFPPYWLGGSLWGYSAFPSLYSPAYGIIEPLFNFNHYPDNDSEEKHLHSCKAINEYHVRTLDGTIGHVEDFLFHQQDLRIDLIVIDPCVWWLDHHVLISSQKIKHISWEANAIVVDMTKHELEHSPELAPDYLPQATWQHETYHHEKRSR